MVAASVKKKMNGHSFLVCFFNSLKFIEIRKVILDEIDKFMGKYISIWRNYYLIQFVKSYH